MSTECSCADNVEHMVICSLIRPIGKTSVGVSQVCTRTCSSSVLRRRRGSFIGPLCATNMAPVVRWRL